HVELPRYPFQRKRYWFTSDERERADESAAAPLPMHQVQWMEQPLPAIGAPRQWLLVGDDGHTAGLVREYLARRGDDARGVNPEAPAFANELADAVGQRNERPLAVIDVAASDIHPVPGEWSRAVEQSCARVRAILRTVATAGGRPEGDARVWVVTRGAQ